jgi:rhamnosyl/mannosyltransferase
MNVLSFGDGEKEYQGEFGESVTQINCDLSLLSAPINYNLLFRFKKVIKQMNINKIYVHLPNPFMHQLVWMNQGFLKRNGIKISAIYHSDIENHKVLGPFYNAYFNFSASFYDEVICSSDKLWNSSTVLTKISSKAKRIIPFCVDGNNEFVKREKFSGKLLAIGRFVPYKGYGFLIDALKDSSYDLTIVGTGPLYDKLKSNEYSNIHFVGRVDDTEKKRLLNDSDMLVVSSINRSEAYGMTIVEAFQCGLPVIAANINSGVTFLAKGGERGEVFDILSKDSLLEKLKKLDDNPELLGKYSEASSLFFEENLSYARFKENFKNLDH